MKLLLPFVGNPYLCGAPLESCTSSKKLSKAVIATVITAVVAALIAVATVFVILRHRKRAADSGGMKGGKEDSGGGGSSHHKKKGDLRKLTFLMEEREIFELSELLGASAEILGSGYFGTSYKAALKNGKMMVVKRFTQMNNVGKEEFQEHMWNLGSLRHKNLMPLVAFYNRKEEKLIVTDYAPNVSLSIHLHGNRSLGQTLDWPTRLKIIKGVANGLQCLYNELPSLIAPHGHLKSSNVLLNEFMEPLLVDYGLIHVVNSEQAQEFMVAYKSPEYKQSRRITKKTDVWSFGILILEVITGKFPTSWWEQGKGNDTDLVSWVDSLAQEALSESVFDNDMRAINGSEGEIMKLLRIGLACADSNVKKRYDLKEVLEKLEEVKEREHDDEFYSSYASECDARSSRGLSDDFLFI
ncbi:pollen receptor-like kinase 2 [Impatiens glandulifera]|uniref:pollen receptor-like kinase 2 n=1 Tax=Impatiens glandulifera TaxID=253017 RepID=UPI001FB0A41E|nr:pollen receptor-like kinase 2 [Impatiens glandulifera]